MSTADELAKLAALLQSGDLSQDEFDQEKARLLGSTPAPPAAAPPPYTGPAPSAPPPYAGSAPQSLASVPKAVTPGGPAPTPTRRAKSRRRGISFLAGVVVIVVIVVIATSGGGSSKPAAAASDPLVAKVINVVAKPGNKSAVVVYVWNTSKKAVSAACGIWQFLPINQGGSTPDMTAMVGSDTWSFVSPFSPPHRMDTQRRCKGRWCRPLNLSSPRSSTL